MRQGTVCNFLCIQCNIYIINKITMYAAKPCKYYTLNWTNFVFVPYCMYSVFYYFVLASIWAYGLPFKSLYPWLRAYRSRGGGGGGGGWRGFRRSQFPLRLPGWRSSVCERVLTTYIIRSWYQLMIADSFLSGSGDKVREQIPEMWISWPGRWAPSYCVDR